MSIDKQITRMAQRGVPAVLMFGKWWPLQPGQYRVQFNFARPAKSKIVRL